MPKPKRYSYCLTLRLEPCMETELENLAYDLKLSKAGTIRRAIRRAIVDAYQHDYKTFTIQGGAR